jgi:hypothetical protein
MYRILLLVYQTHETHDKMQSTFQESKASGDHNRKN